MGSWTRRKLGVYKGQEGKVWNLMKVAWRQVGQEACVLDAGTLFLLPHCLLVLLLLLTVLNFSLSYGDLVERELSRSLPETLACNSLALYPGSFGGRGKREPGIHCLRMCSTL